MSERGLFFLPAVALVIVYSQGFIEVVKSRVRDHNDVRDMLLFSKRYSSADLLRLGLVEQVLSGEAAMDTAISLIREKRQEHRFPLSEVKRRLYHTAFMALNDERVSDMHWERLSRSKL
jgi:enoyl-CoA hydratase/carnithine racemase